MISSATEIIGMRASLSVLAALLGIAQLAAASPPSESEHQVRIARDAFYKCAQMTVPDYDDAISPANVVAKAVAFKCQNWVNAMVKYMPQTEGRTLYNEIMRGEEGNLLGVVLRHRVLKSTPPPVVAARDEKSPLARPVLSGPRKTAPKPSVR
jgi:hypothetical protein